MDKEIKNRFQSVRNTIQAGADAFDIATDKKLLQSLNQIIDSLVESKASKNSQIQSADEINELLTEASLSGLKYTVAEILDAEIYFKFGTWLHYTDLNDPSLIHTYLDMLRLPPFLKKLYGDKRWEPLILELLRKSRFTVPRLLDQRWREYERKTLFRILNGQKEDEIGWHAVKERVILYARILRTLLPAPQEDSPKIAFLMENSPEMALLDLACLYSGIVNIMIPANSVPEQIEFILNETKAPLILLSGDRALAKVKQVKSSVPPLQKAILAEGKSVEGWVMSLKDLEQQALPVSEQDIEEHARIADMDSLATIMYTSGTTGNPKGIMFSHTNIVYKRFCRALALPEIGEADRFLSYLPLYHTFGRWLEMMGAVFWGAEYAFMENPSLATMLDNMQRVKPTVFISIPKKWYQLYEHITGQVNLEFDESEKIRENVQDATGGYLRWGLSAAGHLDSDVFRFFQRNGIELMSGFGMTEATGGITMTPPGQYIPNTLGVPLPGIDVKLGHDGEMMIRGAYVMLGYYGARRDEVFDPEGWLPTGDIMEQNDEDYYVIIDRKKEIYKNIKGETIAPQKIENLFNDFDYIRQVFLVGDHRPYNTVLIYPDYSGSGNPLQTMNEEDRQAYFASVVVTVNKFLAPYERIIDFRLIDRAFTAAKGELTPKSTYRRRVIESHFEPVINAMYQKHYISLPFRTKELRVPNWFLREKGCLAGDLNIDRDGLRISKYEQKLPLKTISKQDNYLQIGDYIYAFDDGFVDLQEIFANPFYWLGNDRLRAFTGESIFQWYRMDDLNEHIRFVDISRHKRVDKERRQRLETILQQEEKSLFGLDLAVRLLQSPLESQAMIAIQYLKLILDDTSLTIYPLALAIVRHPQFAGSLSITRQMFLLGLPRHAAPAFGAYLHSYIEQDPHLLDDSLRTKITGHFQGDEGLHAIHDVLKKRLKKQSSSPDWTNNAIPSLLQLMAMYGVAHPTRYKRVRQLIVRYQLRSDYRGLPEIAGAARQKLLNGFREWLGDEPSIAVDIETHEEYRWKDVITFEEGIPENERRRILNAFNQTSMLREAIFLFSGGEMVRLYDIPMGGIWISFISENEDKSVFRVAVQTRFRGAYDFVLIFNNRKRSDEVRAEMNWMIHAGAPAKGLRLVHDFGGYWEDHNLWTEDYVSGDVVEKVIRRNLRRNQEESERRLYHLWPFFVRTAMAANVSFWKRTGYQLELSDKSARNIIVPEHDYQTGMHLVSIASRKESQGLFALVDDFYGQFVAGTEERYPFLQRSNVYKDMLAGVLDSEGEKQGLALLRDCLNMSTNKQTQYPVRKWIGAYVDQMRGVGFLPKSLFFAIKRFHRWNAINPDASLSAQARTLNELYDTYQLHALEDKYPETRTRFFMETVFKDGRETVLPRLRRMAEKQRKGELSTDAMLTYISDMQSELTLSERDQYFLTRLSYPHLKPTDTAVLVSTPDKGRSTADVVVQLEDYDGTPYNVRKPISPKEISRLHQIFLESRLPVRFRPDHQFLVAISERGFVIGGLFYTYLDNQTVYMDKIVVANHYRRKGISEGLLNEFLNRMSGEKFRFVTTGFFRPEYFYRFGFKVERKYAGLVRTLNK